MFKRVVSILFSVTLSLIGVLLASNFLEPILLVDGSPPIFYYGAIIATGLIMAAIGFFLAKPLTNFMDNSTDSIVASFSAMSNGEIINRIIGLISGLIIASLVGIALSKIAIVGPYLAIIGVVLLGYLGWLVGSKLSSDFFSLRKNESRPKSDKKSADISENNTWQIPPKVLDTSVIIDGRIADIYNSRFLEGDLIVANFVLEELRHIADSSDNLKRNRGRGGLDTLNRLRTQFGSHIIITEQDYPRIKEVDSKLLRLAQDLNGVVVTNDYNLNKVAKLQGMTVLNINELANAVKPIVLPGEEMLAQVIKEGKEANQGIAYLDDGTMIVVENGSRYVSKQLYVIVTSILQTAAGRMVFAKPKLDKKGKIIEIKPAMIQNK